MSNDLKCLPINFYLLTMFNVFITFTNGFIFVMFFNVFFKFSVERFLHLCVEVQLKALAWLSSMVDAWSRQLTTRYNAKPSLGGRLSARK